MNNSNEPCATKAERFQKSSLSLMDFNVEEAIKNLEMCLHVGKENISQKKTENCTVLTVSLGKMLLIDQLMEDIENILNLSILLATKSEDGNCLECIAYSKPCVGDMIVVHLYSRLYGVMERFEVNVYDSIEKMYKDLKNRLDYQKDISCKFMEAEDPMTVLRQFI